MGSGLTADSSGRGSIKSVMCSIRFYQHIIKLVSTSRQMPSILTNLERAWRRGFGFLSPPISILSTVNCAIYYSCPFHTVLNTTITVILLNRDIKARQGAATTEQKPHWLVQDKSLSWLTFCYSAAHLAKHGVGQWNL